MKTYKRGISLIVLVITVIVVSILAATAIISLSNTNIIDKASDTVNEYNKKQYEAQLSTAFASWTIANKGETFTSADIEELVQHGFDKSQLPDGYTITVSKGTPELIQADVWDGVTVATSFSSGSGTESDPYIISSAAELAYFEKRVYGTENGDEGLNDYIKLAVDIDLANHEWNPIGNGTPYMDSGYNQRMFNGNFDGQGHTIYNLNVSGVDYAGLFSKLLRASVYNLNLNGGSVSGICAGSFAGSKEYATIKNCTNLGVKVTGTSYAGGISGGGGSSTVENCINYGTVTSTSHANGIVTLGIGMTINCVNYGSVLGADASGIGFANVGVENCTNYGNITGTEKVAAISTVELSSSSGNANYGTIGGTGTVYNYGL